MLCCVGDLSTVKQTQNRRTKAIGFKERKKEKSLREGNWEEFKHREKWQSQKLGWEERERERERERETKKRVGVLCFVKGLKVIILPWHMSGIW